MKCVNCGQTLLADDVACWQCGHPVSGAQTPQPETPQLREKWQQESGEEKNIRPVVIYSIITVVVICLALTVTLYLGRQPLVQAAVQIPPDGWAFFTNRQRTFTGAAPEDWVAYDIDDDDFIGDRFETLLADNPVLAAAAAPLGSAFEDTYLIYFTGAVSPEGQVTQDGFVIVARSNLLNQLTPDEMRALAAEGEVNLIAEEYVEDFERSHVFLRVEIPLDENESPPEILGCRQQIIPGIEGSYAMIVSACGSDQNQLAPILDFFQRLD